MIPSMSAKRIKLSRLAEWRVARGPHRSFHHDHGCPRCLAFGHLGRTTLTQPLLVPQVLRQLSFTARIERWRSRGTRSKQPRIPHSVRDDNGFPGFWPYDRVTGKRAEQPQMFRLRFAPLNMTMQLFWLRLEYKDICTTTSWRSLRCT